MNQSLWLSEGAVCDSKLHPLTGEPIVPLAFRSDGRPIWPIMGAAEESEDSSDEEDEDEDDPEGSNSDSDEAKSKKESESKEDKDPFETRNAALEDEKNRHYKMRKDAEAERDELKARLRKLESADKEPDQQTAERLQELESENSSLKSQVTEARLQNAFLADNTYEWHNPSRALRLADLSEVEIDEDGKVHGLKSALDALAKSDPYLVRDKEPKREPKKSGDQPAPQDDRKDAKVKRNRLQEKYPGLRR